jgi:hypothetical protein
MIKIEDEQGNITEYVRKKSEALNKPPKNMYPNRIAINGPPHSGRSFIRRVILDALKNAGIECGRKIDTKTCFFIEVSNPKEYPAKSTE